MVKPAPGAADTVAAESGTLPRATLDLGLPTVEREHYQVERELARGGMGRIFTARDRRLDREVAVKEVLSREDASLVRFEREVRLTARLQHPGIVSIYEAGRWPSGEPFYAMRLVAGRPFDAVIAETTTLGQRLALLPHVLAIAEALAYAHAQRIIHRDLKPANVLIGKYGETVVIDWGLAKQLDGEADDASSLPALATRDDGALTQLGAVMGTPSYMPLEQATGRGVDERADVYAIGAILYHALSGVMPYRGETGTAIVQALIAGPPAPLAERQPGVPADLLAIVARAMARDAAERYPTAQALADDLRRYQSGQLVGTHRYSTGEHVRRWLRRYRAAVAVAAAAVVVVVGGGIASYLKIVGEMAVATHERDVATAANGDAMQHADDLTIAQARSALATDPTATVAWLRQLSPHSARDAAALAIAVDAEARGVATLLASGDVGMRTLVVSADGKVVLAGDAGGVIHAFDLATGGARIVGHAPGAIVGLSVSADGARAITIGGTTVQLWDVAAGTAITLPQAAGNEPLAAAIRPDGKQVAYGAGDENTMVCLVGTDRCHRLKVSALGLAFSPDSETLVVTSQSDVLSYDLTDPHLKLRETHLSVTFEGMGLGRDAPRPGAVAFLGAGSALAVLGTDGQILHGAAVEQTKLQGFVTAIAVSADGAWWAVAGNTTVEVWQPGSEHVTLTGDGSPLLAFGPHGALLAIASTDGRILLRDLEAQTSRVMSGHAGRVRALAFAEDGATLLSAGDDGQVRRWSVTSRVAVTQIATNVLDGSSTVSPAGTIAFTGKGLHDTSPAVLTAIFTVAGDGSVAEAPVIGALDLHISDDERVVSMKETEIVGYLWWRATNEVTETRLWVDESSERGIVRAGARVEIRGLRDDALVWSTPMGEHEAFWASPDKLRLAVPTGGTRVAIRGPAATREIDAGVSPWKMEWSATGRWVIVFGPEGEMSACDLEAWTCHVSTRHESAMKRAVVARDGKVLITADGDGAVSLVTTATGASEVLRRAARVNGLGLSADGDTMIEWDANGPVTVRDLGTREVRELPPLLAGVVVAAITPSEIRVVSGAGQLARFPRRLPDGPTLDARLAALTNATLDRGGHFVAR